MNFDEVIKGLDDPTDYERYIYEERLRALYHDAYMSNRYPIVNWWGVLLLIVLTISVILVMTGVVYWVKFLA